MTFVFPVVVVVLTIGISTSVANSLSGPSDKEFFLGSETPADTLERIVKQVEANGVHLESYTVKKTDTETTFQVVLDSKYDKPTLAAHEIWRQASFAKADGDSVPMIEVFQFNAAGKMTFGLGEAPANIEDVTYGKASTSLEDARKNLTNAVARLVSEIADGMTRDQVKDEIQILTDADGTRRATVSLDFPAGAENSDVDIVARQLRSTIDRLNVESATGIGIASLEVSRSGQRILETVEDFQLGSTDGWHDSSFDLGSISGAGPAPTQTGGIGG